MAQPDRSGAGHEKNHRMQRLSWTDMPVQSWKQVRSSDADHAPCRAGHYMRDHRGHLPQKNICTDSACERCATRGNIRPKSPTYWLTTIQEYCDPPNSEADTQVKPIRQLSAQRGETTVTAPRNFGAQWAGLDCRGAWPCHSSDRLAPQTYSN